MNIEVITKEDLLRLKEEIVSEISKKLEGKIGEKHWLKSGDVQKLLGISPGTLQNLRNNETIPFYKFGGTIFYKLEDIEHALKNHKFKNSNSI